MYFSIYSISNFSISSFSPPEEISDESHQENLPPCQPEATPINSPEPSHSPSTPNQSCVTTKKRKNQSSNANADTMLVAIQDNMKSLGDALSSRLSRDQSESTDELSLFGNMMVKELRRVKSEQSRDKLQEQILSLVNNAIYNEGVDNSFYNATWTQL